MNRSYSIFQACCGRYLLISILIYCGSFSKAVSQKYFQQEVNYQIQVSLNDKNHELTGFETIEYINNSPDTLKFLFFHLWPNAYSDNNTDLAKQLFQLRGKQRLFNNPELSGYIDSLNFQIDKKRVTWHLMPKQPDICRIWLSENIQPGDTAIITTPFHIKIPKGVTSRLGHIGESYQISQWYPKPAVYDNTGWHQMSYLDQGEFYSEFGNFDVSITLPENYIVAATGNLQTTSELDMLNKLASDTSWKSIIDFNLDNSPPTSKQFKTLQYIGKNIHDFAWFADKRFHVLKGKVKLLDSQKEVTTWVMFTHNHSKLWKDAINYVDSAIWYFSKWHGNYPYDSFTAVQSAINAGGGMEYPGIAVIGPTNDAYILDEVITHEIGHNWHYGALGSNERKYPYLDESITSANTVRLMDIKYPGKKFWEVYVKKIKLARFFHLDKIPMQRLQEIEWLMLARRNLEQPINLEATDFTPFNYNLIIYYKAALCFNYLRAYLGDSLYDSIMQDYYKEWKSKHPQPKDLQQIFESHTDKNLNWFFNDLLTSAKHIDYKIIRFENLRVLVKNNSKINSPLIICGTRGDSVYFEKWTDGFEGERWIDAPIGDYSEIRIDPNHVMPELYRFNNNIHTSGVLPKYDPIRFQYFFTMEDPNKQYIMYMPSLNWNKENGFMLGATFHNGFLAPKPVEYFIMPFYTFKEPDLAGFARIFFNITPYNNLIRLATITLEGTKFGAPGNQNYYKAKTGLDLYFKNKNLNNPFSHKLFGYYIAASDLNEIELMETAKINSFLQIGHLFEKTGLINPFTLTTSFEYNKTFQKTSVEFDYTYSYNGPNNGLGIRFFAGKMLNHNPQSTFYSLSANGRSGRDQYLYDGLFPDRFTEFPKTFWSRQMDITEGGLVSPITDSTGYSNWLLSLTLASSLPGKASRIPIKPFVNLLLNDHSLNKNFNSLFYYEAGIKAGIWNIFEIYVPLLVSPNIKYVNGSVKDRIRFTLNLDSFKQLKLNLKI